MYRIAEAHVLLVMKYFYTVVLREIHAPLLTTKDVGVLLYINVTAVKTTTLNVPYNTHEYSYIHNKAICHQ